MPPRSTLAAIRSLPAFRPVVGAGAVARVVHRRGRDGAGDGAVRVVPVTAPSGATASTSWKPGDAPDPRQPHVGCRAPGLARACVEPSPGSTTHRSRPAPGPGPRQRARAPGGRAASGAWSSTASAHPTTGRRAVRPLGREKGPTGRLGATRGAPHPSGPVRLPNGPLSHLSRPTVRTDRLVDLFEYQARDVFEKHGVPVLAGAVATTPEEARAAAERIGAASGGVTVVKAQVKTGGRGKAGGVKVAKTADEAEQHAGAILGMDIKGHTVHQVMIAQGAQIDEEYYFSILLDRANRTYLAMCSQGGRDGDRAARRRAPRGAGPGGRRPQRRHRRRQGARDRAGRRLRRRDRREDRAGAHAACGPSTARRTPRWSRSTRWCKTAAGDIVALDGKVTLDENAVLPPPRARGPRGHTPRPTRSSWRPRRRTSTTSSSTARSASSATAPGWS